MRSHLLSRFLNRTAADYDSMFQPLLAQSPEWGSKVKEAIGWAKGALKKQNRITWYLRWVRVNFVARAAFDIEESPSGKPGEEQRLEALQKMFQTLSREAASKAAVAPGFVKEHAAMVLNNRSQTWLEHIFSINFPAIQGYDPGYKTYDQVHHDLEELEEKFKGMDRNTLSPQSSDSVFLDCGGGWAWWLLPRASCDDESKAMGHCGNSPERGRKDRSIISLRVKKEVGGKQRWEPHLTFILHTKGKPDSGWVGEMKGKGNAKPTPKYHPQIMRLLEDRRIKGLIGGGYLPSHNFAFSDLTEEQQAEVLKANPKGVFTFDQRMKAAGFEDRRDLQDALDVGPYFEDGDVSGFKIDEWSSAAALALERGDEDTQKFAACIEGEMGFFGEYFLRVIRPDHAILKAIAKHMTLEFKDSFDLESDDLLDEVCDALENTDDGGKSGLRSILEEAFLRAKGWNYEPPTFEDALTDHVLTDDYGDAGDGVPTELHQNKDGSFILYVDENAALDVALKQKTDDYREEGWNYPYPNFIYLEENDFDDADAGLDIIASKLGASGIRPKVLEQHGQERLFKRPESREEAERDGMRIARFLRPRAA